MSKDADIKIKANDDKAVIALQQATIEIMRVQIDQLKAENQRFTKALNLIQKTTVPNEVFYADDYGEGYELGYQQGIEDCANIARAALKEVS